MERSYFPFIFGHASQDTVKEMMEQFNIHIRLPSYADATDSDTAQSITFQGDRDDVQQAMRYVSDLYHEQVKTLNTLLLPSSTPKVSIHWIVV